MDVLVVGAGLAGLVAARRLGEPIGGGDVVELGGQWVGPTQDRIVGLARELGLETFPTYDEGRSILEVRGRRSYYEGGLGDVSLRLVRQLSRGLALTGLGDFEQGRARFDRRAGGTAPALRPRRVPARSASSRRSGPTSSGAAAATAP